jgi:hypothetical protein
MWQEKDLRIVRVWERERKVRTRKEREVSKVGRYVIERM